jgi:ABC-type antimicrobial peptide transport system permease subunit
VRTLEDTVERNLLAGERFFAHISGFLGIVALGLACVGLYGLMSYAIQHRTKEIGIRMALGALPQRVVGMIWRESLGIILVGVLAGVAGAGAAARLVTRLLYGLSPTDPLTYAGVAGLMIAVGSLACWVPARRAAKIDPMMALRAE